MRKMLYLCTKETMLSRREAAKYLGVRENTMAVWACNKRYIIPMFKVGKYVRYKLTDLQKFIASREF
jgi:excisionase family DNA binding protein